MESENYKRDNGNLTELLCALSFATGLGFGGHMEHGLGSACLGLRIADELMLGDQEREAIFYGALLKDVACTACASGIAAFLPEDEQVSLSDVILIDPSSLSDMAGWLSRYLRLDAHFPARFSKLLSFLAHCGPIVRETMRSHCEVAELFARQLGLPEHVQHALRYQWERWDGRGMAYSLPGMDIPVPARILHLAQVLDLTYRLAGPAAARHLAQEKRGTRFDPQAVDAFLTLDQCADFWRTFEEESTREALMATRPSTLVAQLREDQSEHVCEALADFIDLKTRETWHHSRVVAVVAVRMGIILGLQQCDLSKLRRAALVHDIGKVAIPVAVLDRGIQRSASEWEIYRLHSYYTQRILEQVNTFKELAQAAAAHHEWMNGQGYHRQLCGDQIPFHGRILAVANTYTRLIQQQGYPGDPANALNEMRSLVGTQFDACCYDALVASLEGVDGPGDPGSFRSRKAGCLTQREVEVLRLLAEGCNTPQIARVLAISKKTVEHHLTHIYDKIGVTCRTAAVVYAVQQGLV